MNYTQIPLDEIPHGLAQPIALLENTPSSIQQALEIRFERSRDDLDDLDAAILKSSDGFHLALIYHLNAPIKGTEIRINERSKDPRGDLDKALRILSPIQPRIIWTHPSVK